MTSMSSALSMIESGTVSRTRTLRDLRDDIVQAFDVLDVERRVDVDARGQQLFDIVIALGVPAARRVGVGELVDEQRAAASAPAARRDPSPRARGPCSRSSAAAGFRDLRAAPLSPCGRGSRRSRRRHRRPSRRAPRPSAASRRSCRRRAPRQGKSSAGRAPLLTPSSLEKRLGEGRWSSRLDPAISDLARCMHSRLRPQPRRRSSARFSPSTLTRGSPRKPRIRPSVCCPTSARIRLRTARAPARPGGTWKSAASGEICGSSPLPRS